jgi:hypothetical protein
LHTLFVVFKFVPWTWFKFFESFIILFSDSVSLYFVDWSPFQFIFIFCLMKVPVICEEGSIFCWFSIRNEILGAKRAIKWSLQIISVFYFHTSFVRNGYFCWYCESTFRILNNTISNCFCVYVSAQFLLALQYYQEIANSSFGPSSLYPLNQCCQIVTITAL